MSKKRKSSEVSRGITPDSKFYPEFKKLTERIRKNIRRLREEKGLTQEQMQDFEINLRQFQRIESGETQNMTLGNLLKISKALDCDFAELTQ